MQAADTPINETQRLAALHDLKILDTPLEASFDRITALAQEIFEIPIVLISLVDENRQWFKSRQGLEACETSRHVSFCAHAVVQNDILIVEDTLKDRRFFDNPLTSDAPFIRFYAGYPLRLEDNLVIGTLCLIDRQPRLFSERDQRLLKGLAEQVEELIHQRQIKTALTQTALRFEALFTQSAAGKLRVDPQGKIIATNPFALELLGYSEAELIGHDVAMLTPQNAANPLANQLCQSADGQTLSVHGRGHEVEALHKDGHIIPVHLAVNTIPDEQGETVEFVGVLTDLSDIHAANERVQREQSLLKVLHQGITDYQALMSGEQLWAFLMEALRELTDSDYALIGEVLPGDTHNTLKLHAITDLSWSSDASHLMEQLHSGDMRLSNPDSLLGRVFAHGETVLKQDLQREDRHNGFPPGHPALSNYLGVPIYSGEQLIGMYAIANSQRPLDQALLEWLQPFTDTCALLINLYRQLAEREQVTHDLEIARDQAEEANRAKSEFLSAMSHELRTPLNAIIGFAQLMGKARRDPLSHKQQRQIRQIEKSGQHLLSLINEVLDLAKIEAGHLTLSLEPIHIDALIDDVCSTLEATIENAGIRLTRSSDDSHAWQAVADYTRTKQVLLNLLSNAVKYNREGGSIHIEVTVQPTTLRIGVSDTGYGIPSDSIDELFEPFNRLSAEHSNIEGTGIGLAITRELVERMAGTIGVESQPDEGSTFWFTLPRVIADQNISNNSNNISWEHDEALTRTYRLLYIEDNPANQRLMQDIIDDFAELELQSVASAELGLELMRKTLPDLVIMDINLPGMSGFQALDIIQQTPELAHLNVIGLSANAMERDRQRGREAGFVDYLTKPFEIDKLTTTLRRFLCTAQGVEQ